MSGDCCRNNSLYPPLFAGVQRMHRGISRCPSAQKTAGYNDGTDGSHCPSAVQMSLREKKSSGNSSVQKTAGRTMMERMAVIVRLQCR